VAIRADGQWQAELLINGFSSENALHSLVLLFSESVSEPSNSAMRQFDCQNTLDGLADTSIICPPVDEQLLGTLLFIPYSDQLSPPQPNQNDITEFKLKSREHNSYEWNRLPSAEAYRALITLYQADKTSTRTKPIARFWLTSGPQQTSVSSKEMLYPLLANALWVQDMGCRWQRIYRPDDGVWGKWS